MVQSQCKVGKRQRYPQSFNNWDDGKNAVEVVEITALYLNVQPDLITASCHKSFLWLYAYYDICAGVSLYNAVHEMKRTCTFTNLILLELFILLEFCHSSNLKWFSRIDGSGWCYFFFKVVESEQYNPEGMRILICVKSKHLTHE